MHLASPRSLARYTTFVTHYRRATLLRAAATTPYASTHLPTVAHTPFRLNSGQEKRAPRKAGGALANHHGFMAGVAGSCCNRQPQTLAATGGWLPTVTDFSLPPHSPAALQPPSQWLCYVSIRWVPPLPHFVCQVRPLSWLTTIPGRMVPIGMTFFTCIPGMAYLPLRLRAVSSCCAARAHARCGHYNIFPLPTLCSGLPGLRTSATHSPRILRTHQRHAFRRQNRPHAASHATLPGILRLDRRGYVNWFTRSSPPCDT